ncbi:hypothetical protein BKA70DRAFT_1343709 [Coprinopsis sp. MPI-PUGE-AT-0042]|nr:hypothetical protein BKA70DRAFT_1343709 [Coprinopsis sp. MPI-PUGE-AT-0042]
MSDNDFEEGLYTISNAESPTMVIDAHEGKAVIDRFIGSKSQQWEIAKVAGRSYSFRNVETQRYLGMEIGTKVGEGYNLCEVTHAFPWDIERHQLLVVLSVPYTNYVANIGWGDPTPGAAVHIRSYQGHHRFRWHLSKDLHLAPCKALQHGSVYRIVCVRSQTVIGLHGNHAACFSVDDAANSQKFVATETEQGWAFQNIESKRFLGLPSSTGRIEDGTQVAFVEKPFSWIVLPVPDDPLKFKLWIPFTSQVMDLLNANPADNTPVQLRGEHVTEDCQWWRFELALVERPRDPSCLAGAPDQKT